MTTTEFNLQLSSLNHCLFANALRLAQNKHNAQDLMQETTMRAFACRHNFTEGTNFKAWVYAIMFNCFVNDYRKLVTRRKFVCLMEDNIEGVMEQPVKNLGNSVVMMKELRNILNGLCEIYRIPFELHFNGFGYQEIAEQLDIPLGTVKSRIFFARKKLKSMIAGHYGQHVHFA